MTIAAAKEWVARSNELIDGSSFTSSARTRCSVGLLHLSLEHNKGIINLIEVGICGPAFALLRCQFEAFVRGVWFQFCASDDQVDLFLAGNDPPRIGNLIKDISSVPGFEADTLSLVKSKLWSAMNDYTHGGAIQIKARNAETDLRVNYTEQHINALMIYSCNIAYSCSIQVAKICDSADLAVGLRELHMECFPANCKN